MSMVARRTLVVTSTVQGSSKSFKVAQLAALSDGPAGSLHTMQPLPERHSSRSGSDLIWSAA